MTKSGEKPKNDLIKSENRRLTAIFKNLPEDSKKFARELIANAAFMAVTLRDLQEQIIILGYSEEYQNGENQSGLKKRPEVEIYNTMIKNFNATMKQLYDMLPDGSPPPGDTGDPLLDYIGKRGKSKK